MQANGAEMLRLACCLATERGIEVCAPVHDAVLICAPLDRLDADVARMQDAMREASRIVLDGFELGTDAKVVRYPDRYMDERGTVMWERVMKLINEQQERRAAWPWILHRNADVAVPKCVYVRYPLMSPLTNNSSNWDPRSLQLDQVTRSRRGTRQGRRVSPVKGKFIAGPIPVSWVCQASHLGLRHCWSGWPSGTLGACGRANTFIVSNLMLRDWGIQPDAKGRALRKLERAGLIRWDGGGSAARSVTLLVQ